MRDDLEAALYADFPHLFWQRSLPRNQSSTGDGLCIRDGWEPIVRQLCQRLTSILTNDMALDLVSSEARQYTFTQIEEKFGGLRTYIHFSTPTVQNAIGYATDVTRRTCELCGAPSNLATLCIICGSDGVEPMDVGI